MKRSTALFLLKMKEQRRISQVAVDDIVEGCRSIICQTLSHVQAGVKAKLAEVGMDSDTIGLENVFDQDSMDPFRGLETCYLQEKYFREKLNLIVSNCVKLLIGSFMIII